MLLLYCIDYDYIYKMYEFWKTTLSKNKLHYQSLFFTKLLLKKYQTHDILNHLFCIKKLNY